MESGYEKLEIYKLSYELAIQVHKMTLTLPKFETYEEGSQIRRSSKSITSNIVEGYCLRRHQNEYLQYLHHAFGSCEETRLHLKFLFETKSFTNEELYNQLSEKYLQLGKMIYRFIESIFSEHGKPYYVKEQEVIYGSNPTSQISNPSL
ncbi:MAG: four helix bundle protein [Ignavibacteria bacterium]|nr:four helix bundle protein [Ignavibacteria bacterium]